MNFPQRRTRRGPNFFLLLVLGMMAFFLYSQYQKAQRTAQESTPEVDITIPDFSNDNPNAPSGAIDWPRSNRGTWPAPPSREQIRNSPPISDWSIDTQVPSSQTENRSISADRRQQSSEVTNSGDWSMEEGHSRPAAPHFQRSAQPSVPQKKEVGDWSIEQ